MRFRNPATFTARKAGIGCKPELAGEIPAREPLSALFGEQQAIVQILDNMDVEIAALEVRRDKTRLPKQGMMQELLTGRLL